MPIKNVGLKPFDFDTAMKGYAINKMCHSFINEENRVAFRANEDAYMAKYGLNDEERAAIKSRDQVALTAVGLNMYFYGKFRTAVTGSSPHAH